MASVAQPALRLVDADTGEVHEDGCPLCRVKDDEIAGLERDIRGWAARYAQLKRDKDAEARGHELWPTAVELHDEWRARCRHPRSGFTADDFFLVAPFLADEERYGYDICLRAIMGAAFDPYTKARKNGSVKRFDDWSLIFRDRAHVEDFACRAPREQAS